MRDASVLRIDLSGHNERSTLAVLERDIGTSGITDGRARVTFLDGSASDLWPAKSDGEPALSVLIGDLRPARRPFKLTVSPYPINSRSPLAGVKSCNYLEHLMALDEAKYRGFHEAIRLNERGLVTGGCMANVFWLKDEGLFTPSLSTGCLPGTTREFVLENIDCQEVEAGVDEIEEADAVFLTSAGLGVIAADGLNSREFVSTGQPIVDLLTGTR